MRRGLRVPCLALALGLGVGGAVPAKAGDLQKVFTGVPGTVASTGTINVREEMARQRNERLPTVPSRRRSAGPALDAPLSGPVLQQAPPLSADFPALADGSTWTPPNTNGAAGPSHLMVTLTTQVRFQDKFGGPIGVPVGLNGFWSSVNGGSGAEDPRVVFDPLGGKWVTVAADDTANTATGGVLVGVSWTADPTGSWQLFKISTAPYWPDRPTVGFNKNWVVVQANLYDASGFVESRVYAIDRAPLFQGAPPTLSYEWMSVAAMAVVPAATYGAAIEQPEELYLLQTSSPMTGTLQLYRLEFDTLLPPNVRIVPVGPVAELTPVRWSDSGGPSDFAPQRQGSPGCTAAPCAPDCRIQTGDSRIQSVVYRDGHLWAAHTVFFPATPTPSRSSIQWWKIDPVAVGVADRGLVDDPTGKRFFAYPSIAVNKNNDVLLGYSRFQADEYAGASYSFRTAIDPDGTMQSERTLRNGDACYFKDPASFGTNQWGAYSASVVDPDDKTLWTIQEHAALPSGGYDHWGTWWGKLDPTPTMVISDAVVAENVSGTSLLVFDVSLLSSDPAHSLPLATSQTVTVDWSTQSGTATPDVDYVSAFGTLTFAPGETTKTITVTVKSDAITPELDETLFVNLGPPANATLTDGQGQGTIRDLPLPRVSISDARVTEGNTGEYNDASFTITLSYPSPVAVLLTWDTESGGGATGAIEGTDFLAAGGPITIPIGVVEWTVKVQTLGDTEPEGDELFIARLLTASGATLLRSVGIGTILDDDGVTVSAPPVSDLVVVSDGTSTAGRNQLEWLNPTPLSAPDGIRVSFAQDASFCSPPGSPGTQPWGTPPSGAYDISFGGAGIPQRFEHANLSPVSDVYCYAVWISYQGGAIWSTAAVATGRPFDATGPVKWKYFTGASDLVAPTVGEFAVLAPSNDTYVHAVQRGPTGGAWPGLWRPLNLSYSVHWRSPIVSLGAGPRAFVTTDDGRVHAIDVSDGSEVWSTLLPEGKATAAPAAIFAMFGGAYDYILVGTNLGSNDHFYALDPLTGAVVDAFPGASEPPIGPVSGMAAVDYANSRVYFASYLGAANKSLWCLDLGPRSDALRLRWSQNVGDVEGAPVLRGGRVYVGNANRVVWSIPAAAGLGGYGLSAGSTRVKGFLFPDRNGTDFYAATDSEIFALTDDGSSLRQNWMLTSLAQPSIVVLEPGTSNLYAGVSDYSGKPSVLQVDKTNGTVVRSVALESTPQGVGAPSLDLGIDIGSPKMIYVGSVGGVLYAVQLPF